MPAYQRHFIEFLLKHKALQFGQFTLKSGRVSPYFFNSGTFQTGDSLARLGNYYATALLESNLSYDLLYGPAYKGIPLVTTTTIALYTQHKKKLAYCFNRKETKDYGDKGSFVGAPLRGRIVMVDDVISAGTTLGETIQLIKPHNAHLTGVLIAFDRQERGQGQQSAVQEAMAQFNIPVHSIITLTDLMHYIHQNKEFHQWITPMEHYQKQYGIL